MSSPYSRLNFSMNLTSFYDTRRHSGYVYILNTYFKKHSIGLRCTIYLTYHLRRDSRLLNALTASLSVCRSLVFWENIAHSEECFLPVSRALTHARTHTCTARERSEAHSPRQQHQSRTDILTRIVLHTRARHHLCAFHMGMQLLNCLEYIRLLHLHSQ